MADIKILLLRGVNVAGANRLPMAEFREMLGEFGLKDVDTHVQSGNAVFQDPGVKDLTDKIGAAMLLRFGFKPALFIIDLADYRAILAANPYKAAGAADGAKVHILSGRPGQGGRSGRPARASDRRRTGDADRPGAVSAYAGGLWPLGGGGKAAALHQGGEHRAQSTFG